MDEQEQLFGRERRCPICGKIFILVDDDWAYKRQRSGCGKMIYFCSWSCLFSSL